MRERTKGILYIVMATLKKFMENGSYLTSATSQVAEKCSRQYKPTSEIRGIEKDPTLAEKKDILAGTKSGTNISE